MSYTKRYMELAEEFGWDVVALALQKAPALVTPEDRYQWVKEWLSTDHPPESPDTAAPSP